MTPFRTLATPAQRHGSSSYHAGRAMGPDVFSLLNENRFSPFTIVQSQPSASMKYIFRAQNESRSLVAGLYFDR
jgi:hypothetical protein